MKSLFLIYQISFFIKLFEQIVYNNFSWVCHCDEFFALGGHIKSRDTAECEPWLGLQQLVIVLRLGWANSVDQDLTFAGTHSEHEGSLGLLVSDGRGLFDWQFAEVHDVDASREHAQRDSLRDFAPLVVPDEYVSISVHEAEVLVLNTASWREFGGAAFVFFTLYNKN